MKYHVKRLTATRVAVAKCRFGAAVVLRGVVARRGDSHVARPGAAVRELETAHTTDVVTRVLNPLIERALNGARLGRGIAVPTSCIDSGDSMALVPGEGRRRAKGARLDGPLVNVEVVGRAVAVYVIPRVRTHLLPRMMCSPHGADHTV